MLDVVTGFPSSTLGYGRYFITCRTKTPIRTQQLRRMKTLAVEGLVVKPDHKSSTPYH